MSEGAYLEAATRLGREVSAAAIWSGERCSWIGGMPDEGPGAEIRMTHASFSPDLYGGTAGVGLVLAELFAAGGEEDPELRRTALGALEHALTRAGEIPPPRAWVRTGGSSASPSARPAPGRCWPSRPWASGRESWWADRLRDRAVGERPDRRARRRRPCAARAA